MKRIVITLSVDDDMDKHDIADCLGLGEDPTVWEWSDFWADVRDSVVGPVGDTTRTDGTAGDPSIDTPSVHIDLFEGVEN